MPAHPHAREDDFWPMPDLPAESERRWTVRRKAAVIGVVRGGWTDRRGLPALHDLG